jgi:hypothetical protein
MAKKTAKKKTAAVTNKVKTSFKKAMPADLKKVNKSAAVREYALAHPTATCQEVADALGYEYNTAYTAHFKNLGSPKKKGGRPKGSTNKVAKAAAGHESGNGHTGSQHGFISAAFAMGLDNAQKLLDKAKQLLG